MPVSRIIVIVLDLRVRALPAASITPKGVFDAWSWCESDVIEWRRPVTSRPPSRHAASLDTSAVVDADNPADLVFVVKDGADASFLPRELARLHASGYGLRDEWALAPWAIDDATDLFYERRVRPRDVFWLAAPSLRALVWGLHDWAHFHNHGPFDEPAHTELACDLVALTWLRDNRDVIGLDDAHLERVARELAALSRTRFEGEGKRPPVEDLEALFLGPYPGSSGPGWGGPGGSGAGLSGPRSSCG
jgi:hypothetical protein